MPLKIGLDPGHGGKDPGAIGPSLVKEKDVVLAVANHLRDLLFWQGHNVVMTHERDETKELKERSDFLNRERCDLVISLHCNASVDPEASYIATFVFSDQGKAGKLARYVQNELVRSAGWLNGGVRVKDFHMLRETVAPAILVEMGFISNPVQEKALAQPEFQKKLAQAIAEGVRQYLQSETPAPPEPKKDDGQASGTIEPWAKSAVAKAVKMGLTDGKDLTRSEQRVLVWLDRLGLLK